MMTKCFLYIYCIDIQKTNHVMIQLYQSQYSLVQYTICHVSIAKKLSLQKMPFFIINALLTLLISHDGAFFYNMSKLKKVYSFWFRNVFIVHQCGSTSRLILWELSLCCHIKLQEEKIPRF